LVASFPASAGPFKKYVKNFNEKNGSPCTSIAKNKFRNLIQKNIIFA